MPEQYDITPKSCALHFIPLELRVPLKFGHETLTYVTCARVRMTVETADGRSADGWGETPLSVQWVWPSTLPYDERHECLNEFTRHIARAWSDFDVSGHALEVGHSFIENRMSQVLEKFNANRDEEAMPLLAALVCTSAFDIALHDAYGMLHDVPTYSTYNKTYMKHDLEFFMSTAMNSQAVLDGLYPEDFFDLPHKSTLPAWHLVGGKDWIEPEEDDGSGPNDEYPVLLRDWIRTDGLNCLKIKLRGNDATWDYARLLQVGNIAIEENVDWLTTDFNCTVTDPAYVNDLLDRLVLEHPRIYGMILYVEQPFPYDLDEHNIDVHSVSARKPLFMDESAHDWRVVRQGRELGWTGVALKTCKTQTGALLSLCWAKAHGMTLMVQDLTNPMLAQIPHVLLAAHAGTIMGVETNSMQFYPAASLPEAAVHPDIYKRRNGQLDLGTLTGPGFGYRIDEIERDLPDPE